MEEITSVANAYLTFKMGDESFATPVSKVREILEFGKVTRVPNAPPYLRGIVNLRGQVLPVVDTRMKFGLPSVEETPRTRIIVLELKTNDKLLQFGALVDTARDVVEISEERIMPPPSMDDFRKAEFIEGVVETEGEFVMLIKVDKVFSREEVNTLTQHQENDS
ncbi:MAG: chemotaxis protein CheW [Cyclobacteriaceae bacterium]